MKAITDDLHAALMSVLAQLPHGQVEQLVIGLRSAVEIPEPIAAQLLGAAQESARQVMIARLAQLAPPDKPGNGAKDQP